MDIISHTLTGVAVGTVFANLANTNWRHKTGLILLGALGGALPDLDAISLWSKFDETLGTLFNFQHSGKEIYFEKFWYSHHGAFHSILAPLILILLWASAKFMFKKGPVKSSLKAQLLPYLAFFLGFFFHLLEDMPTPASVWGGVNLFYPSPTYVGGFGDIWWWNNYDLVLIILSVILVNLLLLALPKLKSPSKASLSIVVFLLGFCAFAYQVKNRPVDFNYTGHSVDYNAFEAKSKRVQREILGHELFEFMTALDNKIPLNF